MTYQEFYRFFYTIMADNELLYLIDDAKSRKFYYLMQHMLEVNKSMNLTAIREEKAVIVRHFADSLTVAPFLPQNAKIIDVGCGAGFPCLPLGIARPDLSITALDSTEKRIRYVSETAKSLELTRFDVIAARAEVVGHQKQREAFDVATARAVAALPVLCELCLPLVRVDGSFIAMKAKRGEEELANAKQAITRLGGEINAIKTLVLKNNGEEDERLLIEIKKTRSTPNDLPRSFAQISKKPL